MTRLYRTVWCLLALLFVACGESVYEPPRYTLSGTITDSVTGVPVYAALVTAGEGSAVSDTVGDFFVPADSGAVELRVTHGDYEEYSRTLQLSRKPVERNSHASRSSVCSRLPERDSCFRRRAKPRDSVGRRSAGIRDGRHHKRPSTVVVRNTSFELSISHVSENVNWVYSDSLTIQVAVWLTTGLSSRDSVIWTLFDLDGNSAKWLCYPAGFEPNARSGRSPLQITGLLTIIVKKPSRWSMGRAHPEFWYPNAYMGMIRSSGERLRQTGIHAEDK